MSNVTEQSGLATELMTALRHRGRKWPGLRMTPMIDVIFLLLTFFVLTVQFDRPEQALPLVFGPTAAPEAATPPAMEIAIAPHGMGCAVTVDQTSPIIIARQSPASGLAELAEHVSSTVLAGGQNTQQPIKIRCQEAVSWELVTKIYDVLYGMGARDIAFVVED